MGFKVFEVTEKAVADARAVGVYGDTKKRLTRMARRAAPLTHERGNRRFGVFILAVTGERVVGVDRF